MLKVSSAAIAVLEEARTAQDVPEDHGLRVWAEPDPQDPTRSALGVGFVAEPAEGDEVTQEGGTDVYVAPEVAEPLAQSVIDVEDAGAGPQLIIRDQEPEQD